MGMEAYGFLKDLVQESRQMCHVRLVLWAWNMRLFGAQMTLQIGKITWKRLVVFSSEHVTNYLAYIKRYISIGNVTSWILCLSQLKILVITWLTAGQIFRLSRDEIADFSLFKLNPTFDWLNYNKNRYFPHAPVAIRSNVEKTPTLKA